jgi:hypothetical protein
MAITISSSTQVKLKYHLALIEARHRFSGILVAHGGDDMDDKKSQNNDLERGFLR